MSLGAQRFWPHDSIREISWNLPHLSFLTNDDGERYTTLASFGTNAKGNPDIGYQPLSLVEGQDGNLYFNNSVEVYKLDSSGVVTPVYRIKKGRKSKGEGPEPCKHAMQ